MKIKHAKKWSAYTRYVVEPSSDEIFLTRKFKPQIIFNAKISRSYGTCTLIDKMMMCVLRILANVHNYTI